MEMSKLKGTCCCKVVLSAVFIIIIARRSSLRFPFIIICRDVPFWYGT